MRLEEESSFVRLVALVLLLLVSGASSARAADVELNNFTVKELRTLERRAVTLHLASGRDLDGTVVRVNERLLILSRGRGVTYVELSRIEALTIAPVVAPSRVELETMAKTLAPPVPIEVEWKSIGTDDDSRVVLSRALEDLTASLRATASDAEGKAALAKIARVVLSFAPSSSASVEKSSLSVRYDPKNPPDVRALQSMIENKL